ALIALLARRRVLSAAEVGGAVVTPPASLKTVPPPKPVNLSDFVVDETAAVALGKALFWDMQAGSAGGQACATCRFHAGADSRMKNQVNPGILHGGTTFETVGPNGTLTPADFPFHALANPVDARFGVLRDADDVVSSQGVFLTQFVDVVPGQAAESCLSLPAPVSNAGGKNTRRVEPRNTPTAINAVYNFRNFWDGRANAIFNGVNPFGLRDPNARVLQIQPDASVVPVAVAIFPGSAAS